MLDTRALTKTSTQANLLRTIIRLYETTRIERDGKKYLAIQLDRFAKMLGVKAKSTILRALQWLEGQGFIGIRRDRWCRSPRLYIRPLVKARATSTQRESNVTGEQDATCNHNTPEKQEISQSTGDKAPAPRKRFGLKGSLKDAPEKIKEKQEVTRARTREKKPTPRIAALAWNRILSEYGYPAFDAYDMKHLSAVKATIKRLGVPTLALFKSEIERRVGLWQNKRPARFAKTPPHPWAINRCWAVFEPEPEEDEDVEPKFTEKTQAPGNAYAKADKPSESVVEGPKPGKGFFGLFSGKAGKDGK